MTLRQLRYIVTIINCGSISGTAKCLFITQPSLSNSVRKLEKEMGISIFNRSSKGVALPSQGMEFLPYARRVLEQAELLEQHYTNKKSVKRICSISTQHYALAVNAFANLVSCQDTGECEFALKETRTYEIIDDIESYRSELGIPYTNNLNRKVLEELFKENDLLFYPLPEANLHVFISITHPLSIRDSVAIEDLGDYPFLTFKQGEKNFSYFSEGILNIIPRREVIYVSDRATLFNLLIELNGYAICSGILNRNPNGDSIVAVPLETEENMVVGWIGDPRIHLSESVGKYLEELHRLISNQS